MPTKHPLIFCAIPLSLLLSGCGGSGGDTYSSSLTHLGSYSQVEPQRVASSSLSTGVGSGSWSVSIEDAGYGTGFAVAFESTVPFMGINYKQGTSVSNLQLWPTNHLTDTNASEAWNLGWTGKGTIISVIDDFQSSIGSASWSNIEMLRGVFTGDVSMLYLLDYKLKSSVTHGDLVANIAGGDGTPTFLSYPVNAEVTAMQRLSCSYTGANWFYECGDNFVPYHKDYLDDVGITFIRAAGVAKDAIVVNNHVDLSINQNVQNTTNAIYAHFENSSDTEAINLSLGLEINTVGVSYSELLTDINASQKFSATDAVVAVAAGNGGAACTASNLNGCNAMAIALAVQEETKRNTLIVGATQGTGSQEQLATYSSRAGMFKDRFILANGETGISGFTGTSFASPRVAGAAAVVRQKFPNLSGSQTASLLLLTASKDINNDGFDDFTGTSNFYGHGKLDLISALSPQGSLAIKN